MKRFFAVVALATAFAITTPGAFANTITIGSSFTVSGDVVSPPATTTTPALDNVYAYGGSGTFSDVGPTPILLTSTPTTPAGPDEFSLTSGIIGDTFDILGSDGQSIVFTVSSDSMTGCGLAFVCGLGTITDTGATGYSPTVASWSASLATTGSAPTEVESFTFVNITSAAATPEPSSLLLLGTGLLGGAGLAWKKMLCGRSLLVS
jgi:hypothetical protein